MRKITVAARIVVAMGILTTATVAHAPLLDLDSCHDDLDRLLRTASDASDAAEDARSKSEEFEDCRRDPELHDLLGDGCRSLRSDDESALSDLESKMDDLDSRLHSVQSSCGYEFTINRMSSPEAAQHHLEAVQRRLCASYKTFLGSGMTLDNVLQMCKANMDGQWCKACLGLK
jgi:hypothetical protein